MSCGGSSGTTARTARVAITTTDEAGRQDYFLDEMTFEAFQQFIHQLTGIHYTSAKRYLLDA